MGKILVLVAVIVIIALAGFFYFKHTPQEQVQPVTSQNVDSTLNQQSADIDATISQVDQDLKKLDQTNQSESDLQGI